jgi:Protein ChrB, N-terminal
MNSQFVLLIVSLPPNPSSLRVRVWRRLRALGAVALKRTVYLLPDTPDNYEQFQWLGQEIQRERGETILLRVDQIENMSRSDIVRLFHEARDPDYRQLAARYRKLMQTLERKSAAASARVDQDLAQLQKDFQKLRELDFFMHRDAPKSSD